MVKIQTVGAFEAKTHFSALLEKVERGQQVTITRHGHPVAKLIPANESNNCESKRQAIKELLEFGRGRALAGLDWKKLRDEGRR